jgi:hypothetical protein
MTRKVDMKYPKKARLVAVLTIAGAALARPVSAQVRRPSVPPVPPNLTVPAGNIAVRQVRASGTQNYVCLVDTTGPVWKFVGPQATLFVDFPWIQGAPSVQVGTHFLSPNPAEMNTPRPAWQSSLDSSMVWGKAIASSTDPAYVAAGAIPWLLVEVAGRQAGPTGGSDLVPTTYIHRLNTSGGMSPSTGCTDSTIGTLALVPYTTDYYFYQAATN